MTSLLEGAKRLITRGGTDLGDRIEGLTSAAAAGRGRLPDQLVDEARASADRAAGRMRLSAEHTVVGIAGATGSGKSSTFNALTGLELSAVGVRRPTTSWATACVWGSDGAEELLEWLGIPPRHQTTRESMLDTRREDRDLDGVVLLDLPDHDSTEVAHHLEVDRLVLLTDLLVWVLDPQKYADAAIHDRYLAPLRTHGDVMVVVLNHIDTVPEDRRDAMVADVRRLLEADGLGQVPVYAVSARHDLGIGDLRGELVRRVRDKAATRSRVEADLRSMAARLDEASGSGRPRSLTSERVERLDAALCDAAGVPTVVAAVERSTHQRAARATGWPVVSWLGRLRPDPLKRLHLDLGESGRELVSSARTSLPQTTLVQRARVDTEVRAVSDEASAGLGRPWAEAVRRASTSRIDDLGDRLDAAVTATDLGVAKLPWWATLVRSLQWLLLAVGVAGLVWLVALAAASFLGLPEVTAPSVGGLPAPTLMLVGGVLLGVVLAALSRLLVRATARSRARSARQRLESAVHEVSEELVVAPVEAELAAYTAFRAGLEVAGRR